MEVVASLSQGRTAAAQCGLFTHKSVPGIFEPPWMYLPINPLILSSDPQSSLVSIHMDFSNSFSATTQQDISSYYDAFTLRPLTAT